MTSGRWGGREAWRTTTQGLFLSVGCWEEGANGLQRFRTLYSGYDPDTAKEIADWARSKKMDVKCYAGHGLDRLIEIP